MLHARQFRALQSLPLQSEIIRAAGFLMLALIAKTFSAVVQDSIDIVARSGKEQMFAGFGMHHGGNRYLESDADTIAKLIVRDLKITHARIYPMAGNPGTSGYIAQSIAGFDNNYLFSTGGKNVWDYWKDVNPDLMWICSFELNTITGPVLKSTEFMKPYCDTIAVLINEMALQRDIHFSWVGIVNEPNDTKEGVLDTATAADGSDSIYVRRRVEPELYAELIKTMRASLDEHGLDTVKIMGPEASNVDDVCYAYLDAIKKDSAAHASFEVLFSKAYNMCASTDMKTFARENNIPYLAAAGANTIEAPQDILHQFPYENTTDNTHYAADAAARILNDLNHGVTHWAWYLNVQEFFHTEPSHRLMWAFNNQTLAANSIDDVEKGFALPSGFYVVPSLKYFYIKQLAHAFDAGGYFRDCRAGASRPAGMTDDMFYTYGQKPAVNASVTSNPDSTWTIAVVNLTGATSDTAANPRFTYFDSVSYTVTVTIEELADIPALKFSQVRSNKVLRLEEQDSLTMTDGGIAIAIEPLELVTLRSANDGGVSAKDGRQAAIAADMKGLCVLRKGVLTLIGFRPGAYDVSLIALDGSSLFSHKAASVLQENKVVRLSSGAISNGMYCVKVIAERGHQKLFRVVVR